MHIIRKGMLTPEETGKFAFSLIDADPITIATYTYSKYCIVYGVKDKLDDVFFVDHINMPTIAMPYPTAPMILSRDSEIIVCKTGKHEKRQYKASIFATITSVLKKNGINTMRRKWERYNLFIKFNKNNQNVIKKVASVTNAYTCPNGYLSFFYLDFSLSPTHLMKLYKAPLGRKYNDEQDMSRYFGGIDESGIVLNRTQIMNDIIEEIKNYA